MSLKRPSCVQKLCRDLRPFIQTGPARSELRELCKISHVSQFNRWFPRKGTPPETVRMTAGVALKAARWLAERRTKPYFVPSLALVWAMGCYLVRARICSFVDILANYVGGGMTTDQIYGYVAMRRRVPDGEFVLRFLNLVARLRGIAKDKNLGRQLRTHPDWGVIGGILDMEESRAIKRSRFLGRRLLLRVTPQRPQRYQTPSIILKQMTRKPRLL